MGRVGAVSLTGSSQESIQGSQPCITITGNTYCQLTHHVTLCYTMFEPTAQLGLIAMLGTLQRWAVMWRCVAGTVALN